MRPAKYCLKMFDLLGHCSSPLFVVVTGHMIGEEEYNKIKVMSVVCLVENS